MENNCFAAKSRVWLKQQRRGNDYRQARATDEARTLVSVLVDFRSLEKSLEANNSSGPIKGEQHTASQAILSTPFPRF